MGDVVMLLERLADRPHAAGSTRSTFFFDLSCPFSYLTVERVERTLGEVDWIPSTFGHERGEICHDAIRRAERQARELQLPLVWPERFPAGVPGALRAAVYA